MQNVKITCYLPYNVVSSSNLVVNVCNVGYRFIARQVNGKTWVQKITSQRQTSPNLKLCVYFSGLSILQVMAM